MSGDQYIPDCSKGFLGVLLCFKTTHQQNKKSGCCLAISYVCVRLFRILIIILAAPSSLTPEPSTSMSDAYYASIIAPTVILSAIIALLLIFGLLYIRRRKLNQVSPRPSKKPLHITCKLYFLFIALHAKTHTF